ncbi:hypothetical protein PV11_06811 [Exophiala sideris]|uniref:Uncharacterized protein n=1 Tax=Exophiala sideris TaxID=1016849 RepID=A0A0D1Y8K8_9EURO|nr:hypothetical protein PV11_06811 [Exophiala sideris]
MTDSSGWKSFIFAYTIPLIRRSWNSKQQLIVRPEMTPKPEHWRAHDTARSVHSHIYTYNRRATETAEEEEARKASDRAKTARYRESRSAEGNEYAAKTAAQNKNVWAKTPDHKKEWRAKDKQKKLAQATQQPDQTSLNAFVRKGESDRVTFDHFDHFDHFPGLCPTAP